MSESESRERLRKITGDEIAEKIFRGLNDGHEAMRRYRNDVHFYNATNWMVCLIKAGSLDVDALRQCLLVAEEIADADAFIESLAASPEPRDE